MLDGRLSTPSLHVNVFLHNGQVIITVDEDRDWKKKIMFPLRIIQGLLVTRQEYHIPLDIRGRMYGSKAKTWRFVCRCCTRRSIHYRYLNLRFLPDENP